MAKTQSPIRTAADLDALLATLSPEQLESTRLQMRHAIRIVIDQTLLAKHRIESLEIAITKIDTLLAAANRVEATTRMVN